MSAIHVPTLNACLNGLAAVLLVTGYTLIRLDRRRAHRNVMVAAFCVSVLFLISYVVHHVRAGSTTFTGPDHVRMAYLAILISHIILAAAVPVLAAVTLLRAWRRQFDRHRRIARLTLPIWLYVSVTGVLIYIMLYVVYLPRGIR